MTITADSGTILNFALPCRRKLWDRSAFDAFWKLEAPETIQRPKGPRVGERMSCSVQADPTQSLREILYTVLSVDLRYLFHFYLHNALYSVVFVVKRWLSVCLSHTSIAS